MSAAITLHDLSWSTPDGRPVLSNLDFTFSAERTGLVGRNGVGKSTLLRLMSGELVPRTGSVATNGKLAVLRQSVQVDADATVADLFEARTGLDLLARAARGEASADELAEADWTLEARIETALAGVGLAVEPDRSLTTLSGGQRTRAALAALVFSEPDFLLLDEPTNNLDRDGRAAVASLLRDWRGGAVVVSHDRELLEEMDAIVELTTLGATRYGGGWSHYRERKAHELAAARRDLADAQKGVDQAARDAQEAIERKARKDAGGRRKAARGDMPKILLGGLKRKAENTSGGLSRLAEKLGDQAQGALAAAREKVEILQPLTIEIAPTGLPAGKAVLRLDDVSAGYDPATPVLRGVSLAVIGPERVAITGPNGSGKTTLLNVAAGRLPALSGVAWSVADKAMLDQRVDLLDPAETIRENFRRLNPHSDENACRAALARFKFRADAALQIVGSLSGGEMLRAGLACVLGVRPPSLLILDEPTNHLDIDSLEIVEAGLRGFDGALLVVSHDERFLEAIGVTRRVELG